MQPTQLSLFEPKKTDEAPKDYSVEPIHEEAPTHFDVVIFPSNYERNLVEEMILAINFYDSNMLKVNMTETVTYNRDPDTHSHYFSAVISTEDIQIPVRYEHRGEVSSYTDPDMDVVFMGIEARFKGIFRAPVEIRASKIEKNGRSGVFKGSLDFILS